MDEERLEYLKGQFANARQQYLIARKPGEFARMTKSGELADHLELIGKSAAENYAMLIEQMKQHAKEHGTTPNELQMSNTAWELTMEDFVHI